MEPVNVSYIISSVKTESIDCSDGYSATDLSTKCQKPVATTECVQIPTNDYSVKSSGHDNVDNSTNLIDVGKYTKVIDTEPIQIQPKMSSSVNEVAKLMKSSKNLKSGNKKSFVWKYFAHPKNVDGIEDRSRTECLECKSQLAFNASGTTTTMLNHLKSRHPKIAESEEWRKIKTIPISGGNFENNVSVSRNNESSTETPSPECRTSEVNVLSFLSNPNSSENNYLDHGRLLCLTNVIPHKLMVTSCLPTSTTTMISNIATVTNNHISVTSTGEITNGIGNNTTNGCVITNHHYNSLNNSLNTITNNNRSTVKRKRKKPICMQNANQLGISTMNGQHCQIKPAKQEKLDKQESPDLASIQSISAISHNSASINNILCHSFLNNDSCNVIYNDNNNNTITTNSAPSLATKMGISDSDRVIVYWLIKDLRPYSVLEETGMKTLFSSLMPSVTIPSVSNLKNQILPLIYWSLKAEILSDFSTENGAAFSIELWDIPSTGCMYASVKLNYYSNADSQLRCKMFTTKEINAKFLCSDLLMSCCLEISIDFTKIQFLPVVMNNPESMSDELANLGEIEQNKKFIIIPCLMSSLQEVAKVGFQQPEIIKLVEKCRALKELAGAYNLQLDNDGSVGSNIFLASKYSSEQFDLLYWVYLNLDQIVDKLDCFNSNRFEKDDEIFLKQLTPLLEHIYQTLNVIEQNKLFFSASMIKSIILTMNKSQFQPKNDDHQGVIQFKVAVKNRLSKIYPPTGTLHQILWISTVLDPRFKKCQDSDDSAMLQELRNQITNTNDLSSSSDFLQETPNSIKREDLHYIFGDDCFSQEPISEVDQYLNEHKIDIEKNPIKWWQDNSSRFPNLSKLALKYLCIPLANQYGLDSSETDSILYARRKEIDADEIDHYLFLNHNWR